MKQDNKNTPERDPKNEHQEDEISQKKEHHEDQTIPLMTDEEMENAIKVREAETERD